MRRYLRDPTFSRFDTIPECDGHTHTHTHTHTHRQTDRQTDTRRRHTVLSKASRGKKWLNLVQNRGPGCSAVQQLSYCSTMALASKYFKHVCVHWSNYKCITEVQVCQLQHANNPTIEFLDKLLLKAHMHMPFF